jgi:hypothetical protein
MVNPSPGDLAAIEPDSQVGIAGECILIVYVYAFALEANFLT